LGNNVSKIRPKVTFTLVNYWLIRISVPLLLLKRIAFMPIIMIRVRMKLCVPIVVTPIRISSAVSGQPLSIHSTSFLCSLPCSAWRGFFVRSYIAYRHRDLFICMKVQAESCPLSISIAPLADGRSLDGKTLATTGTSGSITRLRAKVMTNEAL